MILLGCLRACRRSVQGKPQKAVAHVSSVAAASQASYGVADVEFAVTQLAQTTMRSEIGKINLDAAFRERETLNHAVVGNIARPWALSYDWLFQTPSTKPLSPGVSFAFVTKFVT